MAALYTLLPFCLDAKGSAKKSRLYKSLAKNHCAGRPETKRASSSNGFRLFRPAL